MEPLFEAYPLTSQGQGKVARVREAFSAVLQALIAECGPSGREIALVRTKLEEACFYAIRAISTRTENQEPP